MNIFYVDSDPFEAAKALCDKHVVKMCLETAQILSTAHRFLDGHHYTYINSKGKATTRYRGPHGNELYQATHINHPSSVWARQCSHNYVWLANHFEGLLDEYQYRYDKWHKSRLLSPYLRDLPKALKRHEYIFRYEYYHRTMTPVPSCMPKEYIISNDPITNYREYYRKGKAHLHKWTKRNPPSWL